MSQILTQTRHPEPITTLVESIPVKEGTKLSQNKTTWEDLMGLTWLLTKDRSEYDD